jgi:DNA-binding NtrC family response regulator
MTPPDGPRVLVVDDDGRLLAALVKALESMGYRAVGEDRPESGLERVRSWGPDAVIADLKMPRIDGVEFCTRALELRSDLVAIILTGVGSIRSAVQAMRCGVHDYLTKPFDLEDVDRTLRRSLEHRDLQRENHRLIEALGGAKPYGGIVGRSRAVERVLEAIAAVADTESTVLITGESGTGKEMAARAIHSAGRRRERPFVTVDCAALSSSLLDSELFGHVRGAFTGAHRDRTGYFEVATGGTVFLDEIGELELPLQKKLLRVLEEKTFSRLGETRLRTAKARVVAATNRDLQLEVDQQRFREDLYYRLKVIELHLPPLRDRVEDIPLLARHFLGRLNRRLGRRVSGVADGVWERLQSYPWPGNVRELSHLLERVLTFHDPEIIEVRHLPDHLSAGAGPEVPTLTYPELKLRVVDEASRSYLVALLRHYGGNVSRVADHAGLDRRHIHRMLQRLGLDPDPFRN